MSYELVKTDVLVIGGGAAGLNAAIAARQQGARVVVADKGVIERSGDIGGGVDHFLAYLELEGDWDTREAFLEYVWRIGKGTGDPRIIEAVFCSELKEAIDRLERIGVPLRQPDGRFFRTKSMGQPGPYWINFNGKELKPRLAKEVRRLGCRVLDKTMLTKLFHEDGVVAGAIGFDIRRGKVYVIEAKSVVISTGNTNRLYENPRMNPFNTWLCPFDTGDGQLMALEAGAALTNMEYLRMTLVPKGFAAPGFNALVGMGGRFMNALGEYYMEERHPMGNRAPRNDLVFYALKELKEGRGPLFIDCRHLSDSAMDHLNKTLGYDKDTLPDFLEQRGEDLRKKPVEIALSECMQTGPTELSGGGIHIDRNCASTVPGLYAAGDCASNNKTVHGATTSGYHAGKAAATYALKRRPLDIDMNYVKELCARFLAPLHRKEGLSYRQVEAIIGKIMLENVGPERTAMGLKLGLEKLKKTKELLPELKAQDTHELMRVNETKSILQVGKFMAQAALYRKESRFKPYHYRLDFPKTDDENWCGLVLIENQKGEMRLSFKKLSY